MTMRRYGLLCDVGYHRVPGQDGGKPILDELPVTVLGSGRVRIPVCGGGYLRLLPEWALAASVRKVNAQNRPYVLYCHPYEFDPDDFRNMNEKVPRAKRLAQRMFRESVPRKMAALFKAGRFTSIPETLEYCKAQAAEPAAS